ncbi:ABC transporter permease [Chryseosolibacter indicus]|uniref:ABC transporter permease n=1 Tax=Chryseosolibacter indicus TaxID=2782351 RepID=A0ABS5VXH4_9BACT|nr:ABC transporter permease [Chryseosolibacter indicus]MBT1705956.1 ABC transporter permease [Chryseosolibacter indicus]
MFRNNFKIAIRNLWKNKVATIINVLGLTVGITSSLLIALFIYHELSFDAFQPNKERLARVVMEYNFEGGESRKGTFTSTKVAPVFSRTFPEVEKGIRMTDANMIVQLHKEPVMEKNFMFADSSFFDAFAYEMIEGTPATALNGPDKVVLTESMATKYFGKESAVGKTLIIGNDNTPYEVTGVIRDYPSTSQITFDFLASFSSLRSNQEETYFNANYTTYLLLRDATSLAPLQEKLHPFMEKEMKGTGVSIHFYLEPFEDVHLISPYADFTGKTSVTFLYALGGVALLIIVIVCFTYINLSTAKSIERAREVGIRKVSGAMRFQLFWQFIGESFVLCSLSVFVSFALATALLPAFNTLISKNLQFADLVTIPFILSTIVSTILVSLIAGAYPAMVLSKLQPAKVLKGIFKNTGSAKALQQSLTVFQFAISVFLIIATVVIQGQLRFIQKGKLGYDRDHVITLSVGYNTDYNLVNTLKNELKTNHNITQTARCVSSPVSIVGGYSMRLPSMPENEVIATIANPVDADYVRTAGLEIIAGTGFTEQHMEAVAVEDWDDKQFHYIINESAVKKLGFATPEEAIGQQMILNNPGTIVGVVKDFHFQSMRNSIEPLVLFTASWGNRLLVKVKGDNMAATLAFMETKWKQLLPSRPFEFTFLDQEYERLYHSEVQLAQMMNLFAGIAIMLACLGLFGLSSYMIQQRTKEISIRKVLGASIWNLFRILSINFVVLVLIAIVIASPIAYLLMTQWLDGFVYRIDLQSWIFIVAGVATILIALVTIGIHGMRAVVESPVKGLRSE